MTFFGMLLASITLLMAMSKADSDTYSIGDVVADFALKGVDDQVTSLSEYMGAGGVIIVFTCNTCPYAQLYEDRLIELHQKFAEEGYPVLAINPNDTQLKPGDSFEKMKVRAKEKDLPYPYLLDEQQQVFPLFGATRTPEIYLLDADRILRYTGAIDDNPQNAGAVKKQYVKRAIESISKGQDPDPLKTKAIGCGIKAKK